MRIIHRVSIYVNTFSFDNDFMNKIQVENLRAFFNAVHNTKPQTDENAIAVDLLMAYLGGCLDGMEDEKPDTILGGVFEIPRIPPLTQGKRGRPAKKVVPTPKPVTPLASKAVWTKDALTQKQFEEVKQCQKDGLTSLQTANEINVDIGEINKAYSMPDYQYYLNRRK